MYSKSVLILAVLSAGCGLQAQTGKGLTARELFYTPIPSAAPAAPKHTDAPVPAAKKRPKKEPNESAANTPKPAPANVNRTAPGRMPAGGVQMTNASYGPLALRYSLLKVTGDGDTEVDASTIFHSGDRMRLSVRANSPGFLYIVNKGTSNRWNIMFPSADIDGGNNEVTANRDYLIPSKHRFYFDENPGAERLFIVFCRQPEADLDKLIYSLTSGSPGKSEKSMMLAQNNAPPPVQDSLVERLRGKVLARDLVFEKVDETRPGDKREKAVYVASPSQSGDARLVVDIALKHE